VSFFESLGRFRLNLFCCTGDACFLNSLMILASVSLILAQFINPQEFSENEIFEKNFLF